jgi:pyruvate formate lyase activating enzyme
MYRLFDCTEIMKHGIIFDIKRYAIHDGPGIRTTIFFKGCPLSCPWCHNPEGLSGSPQLIHRKQRCIVCGACVDACPNSALTISDRGPSLERRNCRNCGQCVDVCPADAREIAGTSRSVEELIEFISKDIVFYDESGGGVTFSGGEPMLQYEFLFEILKACGRLGIHRALDTTGYCDTDHLLRIAEETDLFLFDIKMMDPERHRQHTGVSNQKIIRNIEQLAKKGLNITVRIPLLPGINDDHSNIDQVGHLIASLPGIDRVDILPYHRHGMEKYKNLEFHNPMPINQATGNGSIERVAKHLQAFGLEVKIGG